MSNPRSNHNTVPTAPPGAKLIPLSQGYYAIVDEADFAMLTAGGRKWYVAKCGGEKHRYAGYIKNGQMVLMHRVIMQTPPRLFTDHIDGNGLDNRRSNLRIATPSQNAANSRHNPENRKPYQGVYAEPYARWRARIRFNGVLETLGSFKSAENAATAYNLRAYELFGEFAYGNLPCAS